MTTDAGAPFRVSFVCSGNICRSPMAGIVFAQLAADAGMLDGAVPIGSGDPASQVWARPAVTIVG
ncbi:hypothetical protein IAE22_36020, partial [Bacillus sp. S34]|nr:hypothetical protein [Bacillus sp. S34]